MSITYEEFKDRYSYNACCKLSQAEVGKRIIELLSRDDVTITEHVIITEGSGDPRDHDIDPVSVKFKIVFNK